MKAVDLVVDVGANVGQFAERARSLGYSRDILSFEPSSDAFKVLDMRAKRDGSWSTRRLALGDVPGTGNLNISSNSVSSSLLNVGERHLSAAPKSAIVATESVPISTLERELSELQARHIYLKLDVQGYELPVLRGAGESLKRTDIVRFEVSFDALYEGQSSWTDVCNVLQDNGFAIRYIEPGYEEESTGFMLQADFIAAKREWHP